MSTGAHSGEGAADAVDGTGDATGNPVARRWSSLRPSRPAVLALVLGLAVTAALSLTSLALYNNNEHRLLRLRARELGLVLTAVVPSIQTPLASAAALADATNGSPQKFRAFMAPYVGPGKQFVSASLWPLPSSRPAPLVVAGVAPALAAMPGLSQRFFARARRSRVLSVTGLLGAGNPRLGYEFSTPGGSGRYGAYAESVLPKERRIPPSNNEGFSDLHFALYLGRSQRPKDLLATDLASVPIHGRQASTVVPFGDTVFTVVVTPKTSLGGAFFKSLPWIIAVFGVLISLGTAVMTERLSRRRLQAEDLAEALDAVATENRQMYDRQRSIAQTLQHALLPDSLPELPGLTMSARYVPAASGVDVGGDWYDVVATDPNRALLIVGDVSGHGLEAATTMASVRHAALAYAAIDGRPAAVLGKLSAFVGGTPHSYFATVLCVLIEVDSHRLTIASAGHLPPLLLEGEQARFPEFEIGVAIGVTKRSEYRETTVEVRPGAGLVAYTDGLVERREEILDVGLERLREAAVKQRLPIDTLVSKLAVELTSEGHHDDTAIVGIQWQS
jgi:serine phosphatase RsbU (regulator of sigma subunit)